MKKIIIILFLIVGIKIYSQAPRGLYLSLGLNKTLPTSSVFQISSDIGYDLGILYVFGIDERYNFQAEQFFSIKSINVKTTTSPYTSFDDVSYSSINSITGLFANYHIILPDEDTFFFGPQFGFFIDAAIKKGYKTTDGTNSSNIKVLPYLTEQSNFTSDRILNYGLGVGISGGYNRFKFSLRYNYNFKKEFENINIDSTPGVLISNKTDGARINSLTFAVAYKFSSRNRALK